MNTRPQKFNGFTIVELLIVIVVIAILAAISIVAYTGIQTRAQDSSIKHSASQVAKALLNWHSLTGKASLSGGWGSTQALGADGSCADGSGVGWAAADTYTCTIEEQLVHHKLLPDKFISGMPPNKAYNTSASNGTYTMMIYPCVLAEGTWAVLYHLTNPSAEDTANYDAIMSRCTDGNLSHRRTTYYMQGATIVSLK